MSAWDEPGVLAKIAELRGQLTPVEHETEIVTWASNAHGATYAARCSCGWVGDTREAHPDAALHEGAAHVGLTPSEAATEARAIARARKADELKREQRGTFDSEWKD